MKNDTMLIEQVPGALPEEISYHDYHKHRLNFVFKLARSYNPESVLEVGPWTLAYNLAKSGIPTDTMGIISDKVKNTGKHYSCNLEDIGKSGWQKITASYDLIVAAEVIEHLYINLDVLFRQFNALNKPGGILIVQTPNGVALKKRAAIITGKNPFEKINPDLPPGYGGHIREATMEELIQHAAQAGYKVDKKYCRNYFRYSHSVKARVYKYCCDLLPSSFHDGISIAFKKIKDI